MDKRHLTIHEPADENVFGVPYFLKSGENLLTFRVRPPTAFNRFIGNGFSHSGNGTFGSNQNHPVFFYKCQCLILTIHAGPISACLPLIGVYGFHITLTTYSGIQLP